MPSHLSRRRHLALALLSQTPAGNSFGDFAINSAAWHPQNGILKPVDHKYLYSYGVDVLVNAHLLRIGSELSFGSLCEQAGDDYWMYSSVPICFKTNSQ